ncbi:MAG: PIN domain-containing protein [Nitrososphaerota archaeon]|nr:PIN domain-containing protein [Nitrososphaerota archaeon]
MTVPVPDTVLIDVDVFVAYAMEEDELHPNAERLMGEIERKNSKAPLYVSDAAPYEAEALFLSGKVRVASGSWQAVVSRLWHDPLFPRLPATPRVFDEHLRYYKGAGGRLTYFDSFHAATSKVTGIPLVTTGHDLLSEPSISTIDLRSL